jgi:hypothetical protein
MDVADKGIGTKYGEVTPVAGRAAVPVGFEGDVAAIQFKVFTDGEFCISNVKFEYLE